MTIIPRNLEMHLVHTNDLDALVSGVGSLHGTLFGATSGALITCVAALLTTQLSDAVFAVFVATLVASAVMSVYFGCRMVMDRSAQKRKLEEIKDKKQ